MYACINTHVTQANTYDNLPRKSRNTGSCTYVFLILCSISVWDLFILYVLSSVGIFFFFPVCTKVKQWPVRCVSYLYLNLLAGVVYEALGFFWGGVGKSHSLWETRTICIGFSGAESQFRWLL